MMSITSYLVLVSYLCAFAFPHSDAQTDWILSSCQHTFSQQLSSCCSQAFSNSLVGLWIALIPPALLSHNFTVTKAIVADLAPPKERAGILGRLGLGTLCFHA